MTEYEARRIDGLIELVTEALDEPAPSPQLIAAQRAFLRLSRRGQRAVMATWALEDSVRMLKAHEVQDDAAEQWHAEVAAARRWALEMGRTARKGGAQ